MDDQTNVVEVFPSDHVDDVGDVSVEDDILAHEVRALADAGESRREHLVLVLLQKIGHAPPAPAAVPGAVHEHEGLRRARLRRCWRAAQSGRARAGTCARQHAAAGDRCVVGCSHRVLPTRCLLAQSYLGRVRTSRTARTEKWVGMLGLAALPATGPLWITGTIRRRPVSVRRGPILGGPANHQVRLMRFPPQFLDELRARLPVSEVVGRRVRLKKAGREWKGLSPFNKEKTPSFFVNDQKMAWFDFSSGKNGSIFDFVMMTEGLTFPEAVERLAAQAGIPLPKISPAEEARDERRKTLHDIVELAAKFFEATLASRAGAKGRGYLADRGLDPATQVKFRLGYAPAERFALKEHLGKAGIATEDMIEAGLLVAGDDIPVPYDRFRDRIMFPIADLRGRVIAFGGRALEKDAQAKYLNSPETVLFHKGATLYNLAAARAAAHQGAALIAVEGYIDVIAMVTAGFEATVAPLGTALTADQLVLLWKMADEPTLCFDGDAAGRRAAYRAVDLALPLIKPGKSLKFASLPEGHDPDDLVRAGGREAINEVIGAARPLAQVLWMRETEAGGFDTPERRAAFEARLAEVTAMIADDSVRKYYRREFG